MEREGDNMIETMDLFNLFPMMVNDEDITLMDKQTTEEEMLQ